MLLIAGLDLADGHSTCVNVSDTSAKNMLLCALVTAVRNPRSHECPRAWRFCDVIAPSAEGVSQLRNLQPTCRRADIPALVLGGDLLASAITVNQSLSNDGCRASGEGHGDRRETHPTLAHSLAEVNAAQSSAKGATSTPNPQEGGNWEQSSRNDQERRAMKNKDKVGREQQRRHKATHAVPQTNFLSHTAALGQRSSVFHDVLEPTHTEVVDTHSGGQGDCCSPLR